MRYFIGAEKIACNVEAPDQLANHGGSTLCKVTFVLIYYFGMASSIWWVFLVKCLNKKSWLFLNRFFLMICKTVLQNLYKFCKSLQVGKWNIFLV